MKLTKNTIMLTCCTLTGIAFANLAEESCEKNVNNDVFQATSFKNTHKVAIITELKSLFLSEIPEENALWKLLQEAKEGSFLIFNVHGVNNNAVTSNTENNLKRVFSRLIHSKIRSAIKNQGKNLSEEQKRELENKLLNDILQAIDSFMTKKGDHYSSISWSSMRQSLVAIENILNSFF